MPELNQNILCYNALMPEEKARLVYSTDKPVPGGANHVGKAPWTTVPPAKTKVFVRLDRKGRSGKAVTLIEGLQMSVKDGEAFLKQLKTRLGTGGTLKNNVFEIQGDRRNAVTEMLEDMGYKPRRAGG
jgi:translation initiation factor 1